MNNKTFKRILCAAVAIVITASAFTGCTKSKTKNVEVNSITVSDSDISKIETEVDDTLRENEFVGSAAISMNEQDIYSKSFGYYDAIKQHKMKSTSAFDIGTMTECFTGAAVLMLEKSGKLSLDDTLDKYFSSKYGDITGVTVEDLLSSSVSFGAYTAEIYSNAAEYDRYKMYLQSKNSDKYSSKINNMIVEHILKHGYNKKEKATVSNYFLLGKIITKAAGVGYREYVRENIFDELGLKHTYFTSSKQKLAGYDMNNKVWHRFTEYSSALNFGFMYSASGIISCSKDMNEFFKAIVNGRLGGVDYMKRIKLAASNKYCGFTRDGNNISVSSRIAVHCSYAHINFETKEIVSMMSNRVGKTDIKNTGDELYKIISSKINGIIISYIKKS